MSVSTIRTITRREVNDTVTDWRMLAPMFILAFVLPGADRRGKLRDPLHRRRYYRAVLVPFVMLLVGFIPGVVLADHRAGNVCGRARAQQPRGAAGYADLRQRAVLRQASLGAAAAAHVGLHCDGSILWRAEHSATPICLPAA